MICIVGIDLYQGSHRARCLDDRAQFCDGFTFQTHTRRISHSRGARFSGRRQSHNSPGASWFALADGGLVAREIVVFKPTEVRDTVKTNEQGEFHFSFDELGSSRLDLEARYDGDSKRWSSYLRKTLTMR